MVIFLKIIVRSKIEKTTRYSGHDQCTLSIPRIANRKNTIA